MAREISKDGVELTDLTLILGSIQERAKTFGEAEAITSWRRAFPGVEFIETDEGFTGRKIGWENRSLAEMVAYVGFMNEPQRATLRYDLVVDGQEINEIRLRDSESIWGVWMSGAFAALDVAADISDDGKETLLYFAAQKAGPWEDYITDNIDAGAMKIKRFSFFVDANGI